MVILYLNRFKINTTSAPNSRQLHYLPTNTVPAYVEEDGDTGAILNIKSQLLSTEKLLFRNVAETHHTTSCFNCHKLSHISWDYPFPRRPMKCTLCDSDQYTRGRCTQFSEHVITSTSGALWASVPGCARQTKPFVKVAQLNDHTVLGLIDTGYTNVLVRSTAVRKILIHVVQHRTSLYTVTDSNRSGATTIGKAVADVCIHGVVVGEHNILVVSEQEIPVDILIG